MTESAFVNGYTNKAMKPEELALQETAFRRLAGCPLCGGRLHVRSESGGDFGAFGGFELTVEVECDSCHTTMRVTSVSREGCVEKLNKRAGFKNSTPIV